MHSNMVWRMIEASRGHLLMPTAFLCLAVLDLPILFLIVHMAPVRSIVAWDVRVLVDLMLYHIIFKIGKCWAKNTIQIHTERKQYAY